MNPEEIIKKHKEGDQSVEESILAAASLITTKRTKELVEANTMLARTAQASAEERVKSNEISADRLAKTTQESAELLAKTTEDSAEVLRKSNAISVKSMEWLTIAVVAVGLVQIVIGVITLFVIIGEK